MRFCCPALELRDAPIVHLRVRYLAGHGFRLLFGSEPATAADWKKITADADQSSDIIGANLLSRRKP